jgi:hypothetical protein
VSTELAAAGADTTAELGSATVLTAGAGPESPGSPPAGVITDAPELFGLTAATAGGSDGAPTAAWGVEDDDAGE